MWSLEMRDREDEGLGCTKSSGNNGCQQSQGSFFIFSTGGDAGRGPWWIQAVLVYSGTADEDDGDEPPLNLSRQVQVNVLAQEVGEKERSLYDSYTYDVPTSSLSHIIQMRTRNVIFNYRYYNNTRQKTEGSPSLLP
ncbi:uncharacterized protein LOC131237565 [Magnolia sinica]|uniref:uncharacterized protein LOC131237565 n=1 Tax=Magnolia sinica TaxID=86752 RepID=UPI002658F7FA|nr:uncharacterized protein LOC131237565 [Magnolia sinica]